MDHLGRVRVKFPFPVFRVRVNFGTFFGT
jgi:hypothetical protein